MPKRQPSTPPTRRPLRGGGRRRQREADVLAQAIVEAQAAAKPPLMARRPSRSARPVRLDPNTHGFTDAQIRPLERGAASRAGRQTAPLRICLGMLAFAGLCWSAIRVGGMPRHGVVGFAEFVAVAAALVVIGVSWSSVDRSKRWRLVGAALSGAVWVSWTVRAGIHPRQLLALAGLAVVWSAYWLRLVRLPDPDGPPTDTPAPVPQGKSVAELWNAHVGNTTGEHGPGPLAGAKIMDHKITEHTIELAVRLVPGKQHLGMVQSKLPLLTTALGEPMENLIVEAHPEIKDPGMIRFQVVTKSPIRESVYFNGPRWDGGNIPLGPYADGDGELMYRLYSRNSIWGGFALGSTGSGKSRMIELIALCARAMGNTVIIYIDGQDGSSSPILMEQALWSGGLAEATEILAGVEGMYRAGGRYNRAHRLSGFTPSPEYPGVLVIIDECHLVFADKLIAKRWGTIARGGRKLGIAVLAASQYCDLPVFGNDDPLRSSLYKGNKLVMRTDSKQIKGLVPGLDVDPGDLPEIPGYLYTVQSKMLGGRTAPGRVMHLPDAQDIADDASIPVPTLEQWMGRTPGIQLDKVRAKAAGAAFLNRAEIAAGRMAVLLAEMDGDTEPPVPAEPELVAAAAEFGRAPSFPSSAILTAATPALTASQQTVYDAIRGGATRWQDVADTTGLQQRRIRDLVKDLEAAGLVKNSRNSYTLTDGSH